MKIQFHRIDTNVVIGLLVREFCCSGTDVSAKVLAMYADTRTPSMEPQWLTAGLSQSDHYLNGVAPFYFLLGLLAVYRTAVQSMQNSTAPFAACMIELVMRLAATICLSAIIGYTAVCIASPMAWAGACALLIPTYYKMMHRLCKPQTK